jgi:hypothetical protein
VALRAGEREWRGRLRKSGGMAAALQKGLGAALMEDAPRCKLRRAARASGWGFAEERLREGSRGKRSFKPAPFAKGAKSAAPAMAKSNSKALEAGSLTRDSCSG